MDRKELAQLCKQKRIELGYTQQQLANKLDLDKPRISELENGKSNFTTDKLLVVLDSLELKIS